MAFVLDARVAITWVMRDEEHPLADIALTRAQSESVIVPAIWWYEIRNILAVSERRKRITEEDTTEFLESLGQLNIEVHMPGDDRKVMALARKHNLSVYDAAYLVLALREGAALATLDTALAGAARAEGVGSLT